MISETAFVQSDLRFLIPIQPGQQVAIVGTAPELAAALAAEKITVVLISPADQPVAADQTQNIIHHFLTAAEQTLPLVTNSIDHALVPELTQTWLPDEIARVLRPDGWLFLGVRNAEGLQRLNVWKKRNRQSQLAFSIRACQQLLAKTHFVVSNTYGVRDDLQHPEYLVPLESSAATRHFFRQMYVPHSRPAAIVQRLALPLTGLGLQRILFNDIGIVAQYVPEERV